MKVNIAVCGRFHYHKYIKYLAKKNILGKIFYSYKAGFDFNVNSKHLKNYLLKEYFMYFNIRFLKKWRLEQNTILLHRLWEYQVSRNTDLADVLHIMIHGNSEKVIMQYQKNGALVIGEAVNTHPIEQLNAMNQEYERLGVSPPLTIDSLTRNKMIREFELCDYILVPSNAVKDSFLRQGFPNNKIITLPYGSAEKKQKIIEKVVPSNNLKVLCVGQITFRKGQIYLLKALDLLQKEGVHIELTLVGAIDKSYKKIIDEQGYAEAYNHIEHIPNKQMNTFMSKFDMLVLPSIEDGFGIVVAEALCSGIPVITTKAAGAADIITNHINGYKIPPHDIDSIANAIKISCNRTFRLDQPNVLTWEEYAERLTIIYQGLKND